MRDLAAEKGTAAFGTRLRRLSERLDREVRALYGAHDVNFEPSWFPVFVALSETGPMSVGELAAHLRITHAAVSQIRGKLIKEGLVRARADQSDARRQMMQLTAKGEALVTRLKPLWAAVARATDALCRAHAPQLLVQMSALETALDERSLFERVIGNAAPKRAGRTKGEKHVDA